ncbi:MAG TPA: choline kinase family protein [Anaerolineales bacterium]|nr:choline kinase family protein [Anaerolineales bacterium]
MTQPIDDILSRIPAWAAASDVRVTPLGGGITNTNYRVDVGNESFVVRVGGANTELLGIDREHERAINQAAALVGVAPEVVDFLRPEGYLVTRFIHGRPIPPDEMRRPERIRQVAHALHTIHALPPIPGAFSPFRVVETYADLARAHQVDLPREYGPLLETAHTIERAFNRRPFTPRPCHNDLLNGNFLDDGQLRILDWEYGGMGDVFFDLANFSAHHAFADEHDQQLLAAYFGQTHPQELARLRLMKAMSDFREAMWAVLQIGISKLDFDFRDYAQQHFAKIQSRMADARWKDWLKEVTYAS